MDALPISGEMGWALRTARHTLSIVRLRLHPPRVGATRHGILSNAATPVLTILLVAGCASGPPPARVSPPPTARAQAPRCRSELGYPGIVLPAGRAALVVEPELAWAYYGLACRYPASEAFAPGESELRGVVEHLERALRSRGRALRDFHLQMLGVRVLPGAEIEAGAYVYASGQCDAPPDGWMAPPRPGPCTFHALWRAYAPTLAIFMFEPGDASCARAERTASDRVECRLGLSGYVLPLGRATFVPDPSEAPEIYAGFAPLAAHFQPDEAGARAAVRALEAELATRPRPDAERARTIDDYYLQLVGVELGASSSSLPAGRYIYVAGSCNSFGNRWLGGYLTGVSDGGACYFDAYYDPSAGSFADFRYHGSA